MWRERDGVGCREGRVIGVQVSILALEFELGSEFYKARVIEFGVRVFPKL